MPAAHLSAPAVDMAPDAVAFDPGCDGKLRADRQTAAAAVRRRNLGTAYRCPTCRGWHTTRCEGPLRRPEAACDER